MSIIILVLRIFFFSSFKHQQNQDQDFLAHISIPPPHVDIEDLTPKDYQIREVLLGKPMVDTTKVLITMGIKEAFRHMDEDESKLVMLGR